MLSDIPGHPLRLGSDCTGTGVEVLCAGWMCFMSTYLQARVAGRLSRLCVLFRHVASTIEDRMRNCHEQVDMYVGGFPCQPFSVEGKGEGEQHQYGRIAFTMIQYVRMARPRCYIFENVAGLLLRHTHTLAKLFNKLLDIKDKHGSPAYNISYGLMDTAKQGLPHHRERVYIVGILKDIQHNTFSFPPMTKCRPLNRVLSDDCATSIDMNICRTRMRNITEGLKKVAASDMCSRDVIINTGGSSMSLMADICPCLTRTRCLGLCYFSAKRLRPLDIHELLRLQGFAPHRIWPCWQDCKDPHQMITSRQVLAMIGNAISIPVLESIMRQVLIAWGAPPESIKDRWNDTANVDLR